MPNTKTLAANPESLVWAMLVSSQLERGAQLAEAMTGVRDTVAQFSRHLSRLCDDRGATIRER